MNQFRIDKNIKGKLANTEAPNVNLEIVPKGSFGENEFNAKDFEFAPNNLRLKIMVEIYIKAEVR